MPELSDLEFVQSIKARLKEKGWRTGCIGTPEGPNCLLGAAGYVQHNGDLVVDENGVSPLRLGNQNISRDGYEGIPGMVRIANLLGYTETVEVVRINDNGGHRTPDHVFERLDELEASLA